ncbi:MAG: TonB-dependent receptor [Bacteroidales bacterium]|nr:TonB-dependent receptor [Bacteroidales bacterium]
MKRTLLLLLALLFICGTAYSQDKVKTKKQKAATDTLARSGVDGDTYSDVSEGQGDEEEGGGNYVPGLLHSSQDVYTNNTSYTFSIAYFRSRGLDNRYQNVCLNGFSANSLVTGRASYSQWGGLNHIFRYPEALTDLLAPTFTFGNAGGATNYNLRASNFRKQIRASYSLTNRTYSNRLILTGATGVTKNGWSVVGSLSARFGNALSYVEGTTYNSFGGFLAVEKKLNSENWLNLSAFASHTARGMQSNSVQEAYDLLNDHYYNANWGWYNGKQRNARVRTVCEPVILLTHTYVPKSNKLNLTTTVATTFGRNNTTSLNWYDAPDPRPDYYRYLPSYQISNGDTNGFYNDILNYWTSNDQSYTQVNWDKLYEVNQLAALQGKRAQYMVENRIYDHIQVGGSSNLAADLTEHIKLTAGIDIRGMKQKNYKTIDDLLGGLYWLDVDKFSEGDFPDDYNIQYNDLNHMNDTLHEGDVFGYNYDYHIYTQRAWAAALFTYNHLEFHLGGQIGGTEFWRTGQMRNGRFQDESYGNSEKRAFLEGAGKLGITYKINGRNYLMLNGLAESIAPSVLNAFVAPRIRNKYVENLQNEKVYAADLSYILKYPAIKMRLTAYFTQIMDATRLISFYHDDFASMVNYSISGIDQRHLGVELGLEVKLGSMFSLILAGNYGDYRYSDRADVTMNAENGTDIEGDVERTVYWKNFHVSGTPQAAGTIGLKFNHNYWWVNINANYFDKIYCDLNPERRTTGATGPLYYSDPDLYHRIADQTRMKGQFTLDASVSKSWRIKHKYNIGFNLSVTNLLNNKNLVTTAWEQYRFDYTNYNVDKFGNKYYYAFGTTFYLGINFQM